MLVSFDVVSLFTKTPVDLAIKVATNRLRYDHSLWQRTSLPLEDITDLLSFCLNTTQFVFEGPYYKQVFGTAMGSPVSAVIRAVGSSFWLGGAEIEVWSSESSAAGARLYRGNFLV